MVDPGGSPMGVQGPNQTRVSQGKFLKEGMLRVSLEGPDELCAKAQRRGALAHMGDSWHEATLKKDGIWGRPRGHIALLSLHQLCLVSDSSFLREEPCCTTARATVPCSPSDLQSGPGRGSDTPRVSLLH